MPRVTRRRSVPAPREEVWRLVSEPERLPAWWPAVTRVEDATPHAWTTVMTSTRGKAVRADYTRAEFDPPRRLAWRQELEESPFERILRESVTTLELEPEGEAATALELTLQHKGRGWGRFGYVQLRRAGARQVEQALDNVEALFEREGG
jgi:uncharacterized protein YndB with AHSA1/START domain